MIDRTGRLKKIKNMDALRALEESALDVLEWTPRINSAKGLDFYEAVQRFEISLILGALRETRFSQVKAARLLGIKTTTLNEKIKRYNLRR